MSAARRRTCVEYVRAKLDVSERFACRVLGQHRSVQLKAPRTSDDEAALTGNIISLAGQYGRYGYRRLTALLRAGASCSPRSRRGSCGYWSNAWWLGRRMLTSGSGWKGWSVWCGTSEQFTQRLQRRRECRGEQPDVRVLLVIRKQPGHKTVVHPIEEGNAATTPTCADPALLKALARAHRYQRLLYERRYSSISELADAEKLDRGYVGQLLRLTLLAPEIVEAGLNGQASGGLQLPRLLEVFPTAWSEQRRMLLGTGTAR